MEKALIPEKFTVAGILEGLFKRYGSLFFREYMHKSEFLIKTKSSKSTLNLRGK
jgi:hypothetical protein